MDTITVTHESVTRTHQGLGDYAKAETATPIEGVLFAPRSSTERADSNAPAVISGASLYLPARTTVYPDDKFVIAVGASYDGTWQVDGEVGDWGSAGVEVAIKRVK